MSFLDSVRFSFSTLVCSLQVRSAYVKLLLPPSSHAGDEGWYAEPSFKISLGSPLRASLLIIPSADGGF